MNGTAQESAVPKTSASLTPEAPPAQTDAVANSLRWLKGSEYHTVSACKRFAIARVMLLGRVRFEAYRTPVNAPAIDVGVIDLGPEPTPEQRADAIAELKAACAEWRA